MTCPVLSFWIIRLALIEAIQVRLHSFLHFRLSCILNNEPGISQYQKKKTIFSLLSFEMIRKKVSCEFSTKIKKYIQVSFSLAANFFGPSRRAESELVCYNFAVTKAKSNNWLSFCHFPRVDITELITPTETFLHSCVISQEIQGHMTSLPQVKVAHYEKHSW